MISGRVSEPVGSEPSSSIGTKMMASTISTEAPISRFCKVGSMAIPIGWKGADYTGRCRSGTTSVCGRGELVQRRAERRDQKK